MLIFREVGGVGIVNDLSSQQRGYKAIFHLRGGFFR